MNKQVIFSFLAGAAIGSVLTYYILKKRHATSTEMTEPNTEDNTEVETVYDPVENAVITRVRYDTALTAAKPDMRDIFNGYSSEEKTRYNSIVRLYDGSEGDPEEKETEQDMQDIIDEQFFEGEKREPTRIVRAPQVISSDEFGTGEFPTDTLYYFEDGVIADDDYLALDKPVNYVGDLHAVKDAMRAAVAMEEDCIYIRNENFGVDYELLRQDETYQEFLERRPDKKAELAYD